jgi:N-methylhydantoinase B
MGGGSGRVTVNPGRADERILAPLSDGNRLQKGDVLRMETGGGGGYGHPFDRAVDAVVEDVLGGFVSADAAERLYGVVLRDGRLDAAATEIRRAARPVAGPFHRQEYVDVLA